MQGGWYSQHQRPRHPSPTSVAKMHSDDASNASIIHSITLSQNGAFASSEAAMRSSALVRSQDVNMLLDIMYHHSKYCLCLGLHRCMAMSPISVYNESFDSITVLTADAWKRCGSVIWWWQCRHRYWPLPTKCPIWTQHVPMLHAASSPAHLMEAMISILHVQSSGHASRPGLMHASGHRRSEEP
jgi:hypothetical protein